MTTTDPQSHEAPLVHLVTHVLHKGTTLADRVRYLRKKRRKPKASTIDEVCNQPEGTFTQVAADLDAVGGVDLAQQRVQVVEEVQS